MKNFISKLYEHLKTRKKYNTLQLKYEILQEELEKKTIQLNTEKRINLKRKQMWEQQLKEQELEIIELKKGKRKNVGNNKRNKQN
jgi:hypothetical protein